MRAKQRVWPDSTVHCRLCEITFLTNTAKPEGCGLEGCPVRAANLAAAAYTPPPADTEER